MPSVNYGQAWDVVTSMSWQAADGLGLGSGSDIRSSQPAVYGESGC